MSSVISTATVQELLQELRRVLAVSPEAVSLVDDLAAGLDALHLRECLDEQIAVLDASRGSWDQEDVHHVAMLAVSTLVQDKGAVPTAEQRSRLQRHGWKPRGEMLHGASNIKTFTRKLR